MTRTPPSLGAKGVPFRHCPLQRGDTEAFYARFWLTLAAPEADDQEDAVRGLTSSDIGWTAAVAQLTKS